MHFAFGHFTQLYHDAIGSVLSHIISLLLGNFLDEIIVMGLGAKMTKKNPQMRSGVVWLIKV